jgi:hypothetical protein
MLWDRGDRTELSWQTSRKRRALSSIPILREKFAFYPSGNNDQFALTTKKKQKAVIENPTKF